ncbi:hypothetical protein RI129_012980 [Pyrocoelia pectoralis]|uniref:Peptidase S1 domain-containing protein n=1 Tax=Pyrocoelia pectoralis TaxID=417401 RepID=A0AAN7UV51_9COLE
MTLSWDFRPMSAMLFREFCLNLLFGCVVRRRFYGGRIVGGSTTPEGKYPYQVSIKGSLNEHICGASILSEKCVLTAASCVFNAENLTVLAGTNKLNEGGVTFGVSQVIPHEDYSPIFYTNDVAILKLSQDGILNNNKTGSISLADNNPPAGTVCTISGWGLLSDSSNTPTNDLQEIELTLISMEECKEKYREESPPLSDENQLCTFTKYGEGLCYGDGGGALVAGGQQIGISSWGRLCGRGRPDVYTSASAYKDWILERCI